MLLKLYVFKGVDTLTGRFVIPGPEKITEHFATLSAEGGGDGKESTVTRKQKQTVSIRIQDIKHGVISVFFNSYPSCSDSRFELSRITQKR